MNIKAKPDLMILGPDINDRKASHGRRPPIVTQNQVYQQHSILNNWAIGNIEEIDETTQRGSEAVNDG